MAREFKNIDRATDAVIQYFRNERAVHEITAEYGVNTFRLYAAVDGEEKYAIAKIRALDILAENYPDTYAALPKKGKLRRTKFGKDPSKNLDLFG